MQDPAEESDADDFTPRDYQAELMKVGLRQNSIIFLPTGSGKTFIAVMVLKAMSAALETPYPDGGKISIILVNNVALVEQHARYVQGHTVLRVGQYTGDMNVDFWSGEQWQREFREHQVMIMTTQIMYNIITSNFIDLNKVNLLIFDECHQAVNDHAMRQIMKTFSTLEEPPRVLGLTATLLNKTYPPHRIVDNVKKLEVTFHSKVATVEGLHQVAGFSTRPREMFQVYEKRPGDGDEAVVDLLRRTIDTVRAIKEPDRPDVKTWEKRVSFKKKIINTITDCLYNLQELGAYGGLKAIIAYSIQMEMIKRRYQEAMVLYLAEYVLTALAHAKVLLTNRMKGCEERDRLFLHSSDKILKLIETIHVFRLNSSQELCGIIFTNRRYTAKILYHVLSELSQNHPDYSYIRCNFVIGFSQNVSKYTREGLYTSKRNKETFNGFKNKEVNLLIATSVLEEGVDIPKCTLVIKYDEPENYRSYIQSKGRARHRDSLYYMMVERGNLERFVGIYRKHQAAEKTLQEYLIGKASERPEPTQDEIDEMYNEDAIPPYYVNGPGSAQITMRTSICLLTHYCRCLPSDMYTAYAPDWYVEEHEDDNLKLYRIVILLPTISCIFESIAGEYMRNLRLAKRTAALKTCVYLHRVGELDDHLMPKAKRFPEEDVSFLFRHHPQEKEAEAGTNKMKRLHDLVISDWVKVSTQCRGYFLHAVRLTPQFRDVDRLYGTCYGIITPSALPKLCRFPMFTSQGRIDAELEVNVNVVNLSDQDLADVKRFQLTVYRDVLKIPSLDFLVFDDAELMLLVPITECSTQLDLRVLKEARATPSRPSHDRLMNLDPFSLLGRIVTPWHNRHDNYLVAAIHPDKTARYSFPEPSYRTFVDYFSEKHSLELLRPELPLVELRPLSKQLVFSRPRRCKRKRISKLEETKMVLIPPELLVADSLSPATWMQANYLPTVLARVRFMLALEQLRREITGCTGVGSVEMVQPPLVPDRPDRARIEGDEDEVVLESLTVSFAELSIPPPPMGERGRSVASDYPWEPVEEPKDVYRTLDVSVRDIEYYMHFINIEDNLDRYSFRDSTDSPYVSNFSDFVPKRIRVLDIKSPSTGPSLCDFFRSFTCANSKDLTNLERFEAFGDSCLKWICSIYSVLRFEKFNEGRLSMLRSRMISNENLFYLAEKKNFGGMLQYDRFSPREGWLPPGFAVSDELRQEILDGEVTMNTLFHHDESHPADPYDEPVSSSHSNHLNCLVRKQLVGDKHLADVTESLIGTYFHRCGIIGAVKFMEWMDIVPPSENLLDLLLHQPIPDPILNDTGRIDVYLPGLRSIEETLGYRFENPGFLLQALTHSSYTMQRMTLSYEKLEFLGDAILDFLITSFIFENYETFTPGDVTDLRSALVNNKTFAAYTVRCNFHKHILLSSSVLQSKIDAFTEFLRDQRYRITDDVLVLFSEEELYMAEYVDVPKILGDVFEAIAAAVYYDSGKDLQVVWATVHRIMWREIREFGENIPKNPIRKLYEMREVNARYGKTAMADNKKHLIPLQFCLDGAVKVVYGCGTNKYMAKLSAAKLALRCISRDADKTSNNIDRS